VAADLDGSAARSAQLAADAAAAFGPVTVLVNNAGIYPPDGTLATHEDTFDRVFAVNVKAPFFLTAAVIPAMVEAGGGVIINLGSWIARLGIPAGAVYGATKGALETLTRTWAAEFGAQGIRVNALSPGVVYDDPSDVAAEPAGRDGHHASGASRAPRQTSQRPPSISPATKQHSSTAPSSTSMGAEATFLERPANYFDLKNSRRGPPGTCPSSPSRRS